MFVAKMVWSGAAASNSVYTSFLMSIFSGTASMTTSASADCSATSTSGVTRSSAASASSWVSWSLSASLFSDPHVVVAVLDELVLDVSHPTS